MTSITPGFMTYRGVLPHKTLLSIQRDFISSTTAWVYAREKRQSRKRKLLGVKCKWKWLTHADSIWPFIKRARRGDAVLLGGCPLSGSRFEKLVHGINLSWRGRKVSGLFRVTSAFRDLQKGVCRLTFFLFLDALLFG